MKASVYLTGFCLLICCLAGSVFAQQQGPFTARLYINDQGQLIDQRAQWTQVGTGTYKFDPDADNEGTYTYVVYIDDVTGGSRTNVKVATCAGKADGCDSHAPVVELRDAHTYEMYFDACSSFAVRRPRPLATSKIHYSCGGQ